MQSDATIALSAACLGIALAGAASVLLRDADRRARLLLAGVYGAFAVIASVPLIRTFTPMLHVFYLPLVLVALLILPPAIYHYIAAKSAELQPPPIYWHEVALPLAGCIVAAGFWLLPVSAKETMFIDGALPPGLAPAALALTTFILIMCWLIASLGYLIATYRRLRTYRSRLKALYSNTDWRELRWVDWLIVFLVALWAAAAISLASDNLGDGPLISQSVVYVLTACLLLFLIVFASLTQPTVPSDDPPQEKYARSALSSDHAAQIAKRIRLAMQKDALYLDPNLSLQKLSRHVGALPNLVSQTLNEEIGATFFDYVAQRRIEASKPLIAAAEASVLSVALEVGFNSRSTFYKAFRRETGLTPKAYRELQSHSADRKTG